MNLAAVIDLLRRQIGLDPDSLGPSALPRAITARMQVLGMTTPETYAGFLEAAPQELQRLLEDVAVPETWFFRGRDVFRYLAEVVAEAVRERRDRFRILIVPCSTGEEPYSLAIALHESGVPPDAWSIDGVDLSAHLLERARRGKFRDFAFRETLPEFRQRYFQPVEGGWELRADIRAQVRFRQGNLLDPLLLAGEGPFDLVFCRNLLIYLHPDARRQAITALLRLLAPDGRVCMGHAEPLDALDPRFTRVGPAGLLVYRRAVAPGVPRAVGPVKAPVAPSPPPRPPQIARPLNVPSPAMPAALPDPLARARELADGGRLDAALAACQALLAQSGPSAALLSLMGVIRQARHEADDAVRCYEQALYLDRKHPEALTHLMLLCQERGDRAQAERLRRRLERVDPGGET